jgi:regulator of replication initiation timing
MTDHEELLAELPGLRSQIHELQRENDLLRRTHIDLVTENTSLRGQLEQSRALAQLAKD